MKKKILLQFKIGWHSLARVTGEVRFLCPKCWSYYYKNVERRNQLLEDCNQFEYPELFSELSPELVFCDRCEKDYWEMGE
jgi:hypothetical protein